LSQNSRISIANHFAVCPKSNKYEPPKSVPTEIFALAVPLHLWSAIAERYDILLPENIVVTEQGRALGFWLWVINNPKIPLIITEGAKKAGAIITANYVALALPGVFNGYRQPKNEWGQKIGNPYLIPQLKAFALSGREIIFCFDQDSTPKTVANVRMAIAKTGKLFEFEGCKVSVINWDYPEKGVDDLIVKRGVDCFDAAYTARTRLSKFIFSNFLDLSRYEPLKINERYLGENLSASGDAQVIALRSPKGSNKTGWIAERVQEAIAIGRPVLVITHRIQLAKALCNRFGIDHIEEVRSSPTKGVLGYGLCIDSLHPYGQAGFDPLEWNEAIVILDECEQVIWHMLDSTTCQDNRVAIINNFQILLQTVIATGGKIYLSDADLSQIALDYVQKLIGKPVKTWVVHNTYKPSQKRQLISYTGGDARLVIASLVRDVEGGDKVLVHTTGQKARSKWGTINLESYLKQKFPSKRILRIDRESVCEPGHPAMGCMSNLDNILATYDIVICSPVIETGVSIDLKGHFNSVWAIAQGVQTVDAVCQAIARLRDDVPRHIWVKTTAKNNRIGNGTTSVAALMKSQHELTKTNINLLQQATLDNWDEFENFDSNFSQDSLCAWARRACVINAGKTTYRESIIDKLLDEGYVISSPSSPDGDDLAEAKTVNNEIKETAKKNYSDYCQAIPKMESPSFSELEQLNNKKSKTPTERLIQRKGNLEKIYGIEVTSELVEKDDKGWYCQLQLHYYLTVGNIYLAQRDTLASKTR
jgi:hypothetical protein